MAAPPGEAHSASMFAKTQSPAIFPDYFPDYFKDARHNESVLLSER
jgi:hypothetical protein